MFVFLWRQVLTVDEGAKVREASTRREEEEWSLRPCVAEVRKSVPARKKGNFRCSHGEVTSDPKYTPTQLELFCTESHDSIKKKYRKRMKCCGRGSGWMSEEGWKRW